MIVNQRHADHDQFLFFDLALNYNPLAGRGKQKLYFSVLIRILILYSDGSRRIASRTSATAPIAHALEAMRDV
jgi:hypothetical protein